MAITTVKPVFLNANGVYQPVASGVNGNQVDLSILTLSQDPLSTDTTHAATVNYVNNAIAGAIDGLDYKQAAQWYVDATGYTLAQVLTAINTTTGFFAAGQRFLVNWPTDPATEIDTGLYVISGSDGSWTWARTADMATTPPSNDASGDYVFTQSLFDVATATIGPSGIAYVCQQFPGDAVVGTDPLAFAAYGQGTSYVGGNGIDVSGATISAKVDASTIDFDMSGNLTVLGVPASFTVDGTATSGNVTATALDTLTGGIVTVDGDATELHYHAFTQYQLANTGTQIGVGKAVVWDGTTVSTATKSDGKTIGLVAYDDGTGTVFVAASGIIAIDPAILAGSPAIGDTLYIDSGGGLCTYATLSSGDYVTKVGRYLGDVAATGYRVAIAIQEFGIKP